MAFWLTGRQRGREGVAKLWKRGWSLDFDGKWLVPTVLLRPAQSVVTVLVLRLLGRSVQWEYGTTAAAIVPTFVYVYVLNALAEEYGWRGYALDPLQKRYGALGVSFGVSLAFAAAIVLMRGPKKVSRWQSAGSESNRESFDPAVEA